MEPVAENVKLADVELEVLKFWDRRDVFAQSLHKTRGLAPFIFYDGPPFATGLPHYGHLLAGTIKDIIPRFWTMRGHYVERRFGWDCHGLPVELEIEQALGLEGKTDIENFGIARFNAECRKIVLRYTQEWEKTVRRMGRWVDFRNAYRTMDAEYMETVWWAFRELWDRGLVYEGHKVLPYSTRLCTPLSNFEANLNYKEVHDPAITVRFAAEDEERTFFIAWTTTPWTLPSNLALAVGPEIEYVKVRDHEDGNHYIMAAERLRVYYPKAGTHTVERRCKGAELLGRTYAPLFPYFASRKGGGAFRVIPAEHVTTEEGTGIVHIAPAFGEEDFYACQKVGIDLVNPVDDEGRFTGEVSDFAGLQVKEADARIIARLKREGKIVHQGTVLHNYPFCWRSDTPLIYRAVTTWFVRVESFKDRLLRNNALTHWVPEHLRDGRFGNWLENARDWAISRNRYWGTPLPIWKSEDGAETVCIGGVAELEERAGVRVSDLHREFVDDVVFPAPQGGGVMRRVPYVFDCWFESGSMPYGQIHYPFAPGVDIERHFPADFVAEGLDQTRGWFYTLMVLASALFDRQAFKHVVVNGLVLAEDGKKMSKRLKNYPEPDDVMAKYGADALRLYLINSPLVRAEELRFSESGVRDTVRRLLLPWWNAYRFFVTYALVDGWRPVLAPSGPSPNILDRWIISRKQTLVLRVGEEMESYHLYNVVPALLDFLDELTNWYVRLNRRRFWSEGQSADKHFAYRTLYEVLGAFAKLMAPFTPFLADAIYRNLVTLEERGGEESVHLESFPVFDAGAADPALEDAVARLRRVVLLGRSLRNERKIKVRIPLPRLTILHRSRQVLAALEPLEGYVREELNVKDVAYGTDEAAVVELFARPDGQRLGPRFGKNFNRMRQRLAALTAAEILALEEGATITVDGEVLRPEEVHVYRRAREGAPDVRSDRFISISLPCEITEDLLAEGQARELVHRIQQMRKEAGYHVADRIEVSYETGEPLAAVVSRHADYICQETLARRLRRGRPGGDRVETMDIEGATITVGVLRCAG